MHKGDTIPGLITAIFGYSVAIYTLLEDTMRVNAQSSDGVPGAGFFPVLLGFAVGILGTILFVRGILQKGSVQYFQVDPEIKFNLKRLGLTAVSIVIFFILWQTTKRFIVCVPILCFALNCHFRPKAEVQHHLYRGLYRVYLPGLCCRLLHPVQPIRQ